MPRFKIAKKYLDRKFQEPVFENSENDEDQQVRNNISEDQFDQFSFEEQYNPEQKFSNNENIQQLSQKQYQFENDQISENKNPLSLENLYFQKDFFHENQDQQNQNNNNNIIYQQYQVLQLNLDNNHDLQQSQHDTASFQPNLQSQNNVNQEIIQNVNSDLQEKQQPQKNLIKKKIKKVKNGFAPYSTKKHPCALYVVTKKKTTENVIIELSD